MQTSARIYFELCVGAFLMLNSGEVSSRHLVSCYLLSRVYGHSELRYHAAVCDRLGRAERICRLHLFHNHLSNIGHHLGVRSDLVSLCASG